MIIKRNIDGKDVEIDLTVKEVDEIFNTRLRENKITDITETLCSHNLLNVDPASLTPQQAELLIAMEDALQESLTYDMGNVWDGVYADYEAALATYFPATIAQP